MSLGFSKPMFAALVIVAAIVGRCCSEPGGTDYGANDVAGCSSCRDLCNKNCVECVECVRQDGLGEGSLEAGATGMSNGGAEPFGPKNDFLELWEYWPGHEVAWEAFMEPESYDFGDDDHEEEHDCSPCNWDSMSSLEQRLLTQRSRSMVCDTSCLQPTGDPTYGVMMCNYLNVHTACRACCHEGHMVEGCMPCEEDRSCDTCLDSITEICERDPCGQECQAYVCCSVQWDEYSGCMDKMLSAVAELVDRISDQCSIMFSSSSCETADVECSDNARTCSANVTVSRRLEKLSGDTCSVVRVSGAGSFDMRYAAAGVIEGDVMFRSIDASNGAFILRSVSIDACAEPDTLLFLSPAITDIVTHFSSGHLAWNDGTGSSSHAVNMEIGCSRHVWLLYEKMDKIESMNSLYITVDPSDNPLFISADWVTLHPGGDMSRSELQISCGPEETNGRKRERVWL